jgi:hypothetical protein
MAKRYLYKRYKIAGILIENSILENRICSTVVELVLI